MQNRLIKKEGAMTSKNNPYRRLGRLFHHSRNHQHISLFEASKQTGIAIPKLIAIEEARMKFYEDHPDEAVDLAHSYAKYLEVDAHNLISEISMRNNVVQYAIPIPAFLLKK